MNTKQTPKREKLAAFRFRIADDTLALSDAEILEDIQAEGRDAQEIIQSMRNASAILIAQSRRKALITSRERLNAPETMQEAPRKVAVEKIRNALSIMQRTPNFVGAQRVALAFRNGKNLSDNDVLSLWQDLSDLGYVGEDDLDN